MTATQNTAELTAMTVVNLRKLAKDNGITLPSNSKKGDVIKAITDATPATPPVAAPPVKSSPVRKDVTPDDVTPDNSARIAELRANAEAFITDGIKSATELAVTLYELYPLKPWIPVKSDVHDYFKAMGIDGDNFKLPATARKELVKLMFTRDAGTSAQHVAWMAGAGLKTITSDKSEFGFVSETRSAAQQANAASRTAGDNDETPASDGPVTRMVPVLSMTTVRAFINELTDADMIAELSELCAERMTALTAQAA